MNYFSKVGFWRAGIAIPMGLSCVHCAEVVSAALSALHVLVSCPRSAKLMCVKSIKTWLLWQALNPGIKGKAVVAWTLVWEDGDIMQQLWPAYASILHSSASNFHWKKWLPVLLVTCCLWPVSYGSFQVAMAPQLPLRSTFLSEDSTTDMEFIAIHTVAVQKLSLF